MKPQTAWTLLAGLVLLVGTSACGERATPVVEQAEVVADPNRVAEEPSLNPDEIPWPPGEPRLTQFPTRQLEMSRPHGGFPAFAFSPDGMTVAGGTGVVKISVLGRNSVQGGEVLLWDTKTGKLKCALGGHGASVTWVSYSADGTILASASKENGLVRLWDMRTRKAERTIQLGNKHASFLLSPDGTKLVSLAKDEIPSKNRTITDGRAMTVWDVQTGKAEWSSPDASVGAIAFSADSTILAGLGRKVLPDPRGGSSMPKVLAGYLSLWHPATGEVVQSYPLPPAFPARAIAFLPDGKTVAALSYKGITFYHTETRQMEQAIEWDSHWNGKAFAFSRDGKLVVRTDYEWANLVDVQTGEVEGTLSTMHPDTWHHPTHPVTCYHATFSSDLKQMACAGHNGPIIIEMPWPPQISPPEEPAHGTAVAAAKKAPEVAADEGPESATRGPSRAAALEARTWTDSAGTFSVEAQLLHFAGGIVHLRKLDGTIITLPIERFSAEDQQWVRKRFSRSWQRERNNPR